MSDGGYGKPFPTPGEGRESLFAERDRQARELAALRRLYDVARRRYGRDVALDLAMDAVEEARR